MNTGIPIFQMIGKSGVVGLIDILILSIMSVAMWAVILVKFVQFKRQGKSLKSWFQKLQPVTTVAGVQNISNTMADTSLGRMCTSVMKEMNTLTPYISFNSLQARSQLVSEAAERALDKETRANEKLLGYLAMCSSVAPILGLFGTVWGIMHSFLDIANQGSANITVVAPGIAEALITTIFGLLVAIPASVAYNHFVGVSRTLQDQLSEFSSMMISLFKREELEALEQSRSGR